jgi:hypothetical protein
MLSPKEAARDLCYALRDAGLLAEDGNTDNAARQAMMPVIERLAAPALLSSGGPAAGTLLTEAIEHLRKASKWPNSENELNAGIENALPLLEALAAAPVSTSLGGQNKLLAGFQHYYRLPVGARKASGSEMELHDAEGFGLCYFSGLPGDEEVAQFMAAAINTAATSLGGGAGDEQAEVDELRRKLALVDMPTATIIEANSSMYADQLRMRKQLDAAAVVQWVPDEERTGRDTYEWTFVRLSNGRVESAIFIDDDIDNAAWCQWEEGSYEPMPEQPTHFMPKPNGNLAGPVSLSSVGGGGAEPWCARCPATEVEVNAPGFQCAECDSLLGICPKAAPTDAR